jgi:excinuclease ABC subunit B
MSEELTKYFKDLGIKVAYLHSEIKSLERINIIRKLRRGDYDVVVGINLLREGLDIPEVSLICILDADKEGFLRNKRSLIQTIGRAARNERGRVILYADKMTDSMRNAIEETARRREIQEEYNEVHGITPKTIKKALSEEITIYSEDEETKKGKKPGKMSKKAKAQMLEDLERQMKDAAKALDFERAMELRDIIFEIKSE